MNDGTNGTPRKEPTEAQARNDTEAASRMILPPTLRDMRKTLSFANIGGNKTFSGQLSASKTCELLVVEGTFSLIVLLTRWFHHPFCAVRLLSELQLGAACQDLKRKEWSSTSISSSPAALRNNNAEAWPASRLLPEDCEWKLCLCSQTNVV